MQKQDCRVHIPQVYTYNAMQHACARMETCMLDMIFSMCSPSLFVASRLTCRPGVAGVQSCCGNTYTAVQAVLGPKPDLNSIKLPDIFACQNELGTMLLVSVFMTCTLYMPYRVQVPPSAALQCHGLPRIAILKEGQDGKVEGTMVQLIGLNPAVMVFLSFSGMSQ